MTGCPVCGRDVPTEFGRIAFHYARASEPLRVCLAVDVRRDDWHALATLQVAHQAAVGIDRVAAALDRVAALVVAAAPMLERVAVAIEARTAAAVQAADDYRRAVAAMEDDSGPVPAPVDDGTDDGSH